MPSRAINSGGPEDQRLIAEYAIVRALLGATSTGNAASRILQAACESLGCEHGVVWIVDPERSCLRCTQTWGASESLEIREGSTCPLGIGLPGRVWESAAPASVADVRSGPGFERSSDVEGDGPRTAFAFPVLLRGEVFTVMQLFSRERRLPDGHLLALLNEVGQQLGAFIERQRIHDELSQRADEAAARASRLEARVLALTEELDARTGYRRVVGESAQWRDVLTQATQVAATEATVLLLGESGTGKEVVARLLHRASPRRGGPFVAVNCVALPEQLLEAELFGQEGGAFDGAAQSRPGQLEQAAGGTLFLDEIAGMGPAAQARFLRLLQEREFQRFGGTRVLRTDARIVAATNRDLQRAIAQGRFREDLYYRLNVFAIQLPALRNRKDDVLPLSEAFLTEIGHGLGRPPGGLSREAGDLLVDYHWPGNVRELRNILERAAILCDGGLITPEHLALNVAWPPLPSPTTPQAAGTAAGRPGGLASPTSARELQTMERAMIEQALQSAHFNKSRAAKTLGLTRKQLYIRMRKYGFE